MSKDAPVYDIRVVPHLVRRQQLTDAEYEKYLESLPDEADEGTATKTRFATPYAERYYGPDAEEQEG